VAQAGVTLRQDEFAALATLASVPVDERTVLLSTVDDLLGPGSPLPRDAGAALLERFGLFGVRLAVDLLGRGGIAGPSQLSAALVAKSGVTELRRLLLEQFAARRSVLKAWAALVVLESSLPLLPEAAADALAADVERITSSAHEVTELRLLTACRSGTVTLADEDELAEVERLLGAMGPQPAARLGLAPQAGQDEVRSAAEEMLHRWRRRAESPLSNLATVDAARVLIRTCEGILADLTPEPAR
jgi:hypothetical protein